MACRVDRSQRAGGIIIKNITASIKQASSLSRSVEREAGSDELPLISKESRYRIATNCQRHEVRTHPSSLPENKQLLLWYESEAINNERRTRVNLCVSERQLRQRKGQRRSRSVPLRPHTQQHCRFCWWVHIPIYLTTYFFSFLLHFTQSPRNWVCRVTSLYNYQNCWFPRHSEDHDKV